MPKPTLLSKQDDDIHFTPSFYAAILAYNINLLENTPDFMMNNVQSVSESESLRRGLFLIGSTFIVFYAGLLVLQTLFLFARIGVRYDGALLSLAFTALYFSWIGARVYHLERRWFGLCLLVVLVSCTLAGLVAAYYFDLSWDGRDYQQLAVYNLASGWNPVYTILQPDNIYKNAWLNHYPKGPWVAASSLVLIFRDIEVGKIFNLFLILAVFFYRFFLLPYDKPIFERESDITFVLPGCEPGERVPDVELLHGRAGQLSADLADSAHAAVPEKL